MTFASVMHRVARSAFLFTSGGSMEFDTLGLVVAEDTFAHYLCTCQRRFIADRATHSLQPVCMIS